MSMEQPEMNMRGGKDGGVRQPKISVPEYLTNNTSRPSAVVSAPVFAVLNA
jgi:hypothetical protein